ncbi:glycoside hydrolase family 15 protein [Tychonema sp. LEGE 07203]|uniref:glycoside hydrolase family 15 protein n=1 Tax=Tychonema sp. LEGE 07203 TaxID=1828671 RepID=UPI00187F7DAA|nr:glycoside hydrolase family 15 protein [Tychonema sp. LEGE 07203]MBE9097008.1 glycoside hydrolase family 15 protein [Tychonema sp. LEGE 07203]
MAIATTQRQTRLDYYYQQIKNVILKRQNPITGLLPASTAVNAHGDYTDAWVRDNVYSILAVWGLGLAYRKIDGDRGRTFELEHSTVKLMRGLLFAMMQQSSKVERFKNTQLPLDALHAKYNTQTGSIVVGDDEWGHLQLDATSIFLLILAQMTASGLHIIFTIDEVNFVQNLVYYIGRTYRTPDYGIWERGHKINRGNAELNASSVGMAKAALEAINGLDLFGVNGSQTSVIHVLPDEIARSRVTLESLLPRESSSKEVDAALLSVISFPAFAVEDKELVARTRNKIIDKLQGKYGCKRFLRDGHQTVLEDVDRLHYEPTELKQFEHIECEWPLFFTYLFLDGIFEGNQAQIQEYQQRLASLAVDISGLPLLPELYYVPAENIEAEKLKPRSQQRLPNENIPLVWAQSLYFLGQLLNEGLIAVGDIDPLGRHLSVGQHREPLVQIALLAEDEDLQAQLATNNIATQTPKQVEPIQVRQTKELSAIYTQMGRSDPLGLTGRPVRRLRSLTTSRVFKIREEAIVFLPSFLDRQEFYLTLDYHFLVSKIKSEIAHIHCHWYQLGRPTVTLMLTRTMLETGPEALLELMKELRDGHCNNTPVKLGNLKQLMLTAGTERIDFMHDFEFTESPVTGAAETRSYLSYNPEKTWPLGHTQEFKLECETNTQFLLDSLRGSENLYEQIELLHTLVRLKGLYFDTGFGGAEATVQVVDLLNEVYTKSGESSSQSKIQWAVIRHAAGLLDKVDISLSDAVTDILVRQKQITVGKAYSEDSVISRPGSYTEVMDKIREFCGEDIRERVLTQEILIYLGLLIKAEPQLFKGLLTLRVSYFILLLTSELARELRVTQNEAYEYLMQLSPFEIKNRLRQVLAEYEEMNQILKQQESLRVKQPEKDIEWVVAPVSEEPQMPAGGWRRKRQMEGTVNRVPKDFYPTVWGLLRHCKGLIIGDKLERRNRLDSDIILAEMTPGEKNFALQIEHLLNKIVAPEYRQVNIEALMELAAIGRRNPELKVEEYIVLDVLVGHAVRLNWQGKHPERAEKYDEDKAAAWQAFYNTSPYVCASHVLDAFRFLTKFG